MKVVVSGIGAVGGPMLARWQARTRADAVRIEAQAKADSILLISEAQATARDRFDVTQSSTQAEIDIGDEIHTRLSFQEEKRQRNIEAVVAGAADELGDGRVQAQDIDHDWTARFFADVQDVSSEKLQQVWAKILAGEVEKPGRTSMRTLSILKNMTQADAELFQRVAQFTITDFVLHSDQYTKGLARFPVYSDFMRLSHHDLFHLGTGLVKSCKGDCNYYFPDGDSIYRVYKDGTETYDVTIPSHVLSASGKELYGFVSSQKNDEYLRTLADFLAAHGKGRLAYAPILGQTGTSWRTGAWTEVEPRTAVK